MPKPKSSAFPLRFRHAQIRALVRELADREGISQNEFLEQAAEHEVIARGALLVSDLESAADRLRRSTDEALSAAVERSLSDFASGEAGGDPIRTQWQSSTSSTDHGLGVVAAFMRP